MRLFLFLGATCALLCGCMGPSQEEYYWAHFGSYPTNYSELVQAWLDKNFDEPRDVMVSGSGSMPVAE